MIANVDEAYLVLYTIRNVLEAEIESLVTNVPDSKFAELLKTLCESIEISVLTYELTGKPDSASSKKIAEINRSLSASPLYRQKLRQNSRVTYETVKLQLDAIIEFI